MVLEVEGDETHRDSESTARIHVHGKVSRRRGVAALNISWLG